MDRQSYSAMPQFNIDQRLERSMFRGIERCAVALLICAGLAQDEGHAQSAVNNRSPPKSTGLLTPSVEATDCDRLAGSPGDPGLPPGVPGVDDKLIDALNAVPACRRALQMNQNEPRFMYQLGRALPKKDQAESDRLYQRAADLGYARAITDIAEDARSISETIRLYRK